MIRENENTLVNEDVPFKLKIQRKLQGGAVTLSVVCQKEQIEHKTIHFYKDTRSWRKNFYGVFVRRIHANSFRDLWVWKTLEKKLDLFGFSAFQASNIGNKKKFFEIGVIPKF